MHVPWTMQPVVKAEAPSLVGYRNPHLDILRRARRHVRGGRGWQAPEVVEHGGADARERVAAVGVLHVADADAQAVRVHVVVVVAQRAVRQPVSGITLQRCWATASSTAPLGTPVLTDTALTRFYCSPCPSGSHDCTLSELTSLFTALPRECP